MPPSGPAAGRYRLAAIGLVGVALVLRLVKLDSGLWYDEIETLVGHARLPIVDILTTYSSQNQHPFYGLLARLSMAVVGDGAFGVRLPAALLGAASIWAMFRLGELVAGAREGLLAALLLTVSYHHVWFSQNARGYSGLLFFALVATAALYQLLTASSPGRRAIWVYGIAMALAAYTHLTAVFISIAHTIVVLGFCLRHGARPGSRGRQAIGALALSAGLGLVGYLPLLGQLAGTLVGPNPYAADTAWENPLWLVVETARGLASGLPGGWATLALGVVVATTGLVSFAKKDLTLAGLFVLPGLLTAIAVIILGHNLWPRFFFFSMGFAVAIAIRGTFAIASRTAGRTGEAAAVGLMVVAALGSALTVPRGWNPKQDFEGAARFVDQTGSPNDGIATVDLTRYPYRFYLGRPWPGLDGPADLDRLEAGHDRVWVLTTFPVRLATVQPEIWDRLRHGYDTAAVFPGTVGGGAVVVMKSRASKKNQQGRSP